MTGFDDGGSGHTNSAPARPVHPKAIPVEWQNLRRACAVCGLCNQFKVGVGARCWPEAVCGGEARWSDQHCRCLFTWSPALEHVEAEAQYWALGPGSTLWAVWDPVLPPNRVRAGMDFGLDEDRYVDRRMAASLSRPNKGETIGYEKTGGQPPVVDVADGLWRATVYEWGVFYRGLSGIGKFVREPWAIDHAEQTGFADLGQALVWVADRVTPVL